MASSSIGLAASGNPSGDVSGPIAVVGEVLWDCFPDRRVLGGAPLNVAWNLKGFGLDPLFISAVGDDSLGHEAIAQMKSWGLSTEAVAILPNVATGTVQVTLVDGEPNYDLVSGVAYDQIPMPNESILQGVRERLRDDRAAVLYHGSLAYRDPRSRQTIDSLRQWWSPMGDVFLDINVRQPHFDSQWLAALRNGTSVLKLNQDELGMFASRDLDDSAVRDEVAGQLLATAGGESLNTLLVTLGADGAIVFQRAPATSEGFTSHQVTAPRPDRLIDPVGAGDAFASVVLAGLARSEVVGSFDVDQVMRTAVAFASRVCGLPGATTTNTEFYCIETESL